MAELLHYPWVGYRCDHPDDSPTHDWWVPEDTAYCFRCGARAGSPAAFSRCTGTREGRWQVDQAARMIADQPAVDDPEPRTPVLCLECGFHGLKNTPLPGECPLCEAALILDLVAQEKHARGE